MESNAEPCVDDIIDRLWACKRAKNINANVVSRFELLWLLKQSKKIFEEQPVFLELVPPLTICGDIHGQFGDLLHIFEIGGLPDVTNYLFMGDYVDRGPASVSTLALLLAYKIKYPQNFFMLRGNHEIASTNRDYGFYDELQCTYQKSDVVYRRANETFDWLPIAAIIDGRALVIHGGLSPRLRFLSQLYDIERPNNGEDNQLVSDILWSDPEARIDEWADSDRGISYLFGCNPLQSFLEENSLDLLVRAHQAVNDGYEFPFSPELNVVTIFSAPKYCGDYDNKAAMMHLDENLVASFTVIDPDAMAGQEHAQTGNSGKTEKNQSSFRKFLKMFSGKS
ncbi:Serine/threonine protein phosphatase PP1-gamma catalytic subunit [Tritrichomonas foetus]|uniref:Serine/threonine-protein phosphatase n=1 Tax=Tritrichomonas foetus TaxID=1144522 RepID=A0A1J4K8A8_9EUKA|nr:Serine/threonine protein phosphatase PP1-gamma catalytic subunit [Tritrichomonas foetus]|eukprot:OHT07443.1 Serine/threonine protein phosphatase PP1-gamma catalytic subunit [Tritrichomonas foetus]